jgi:hypothetical protein
VLDMVCNDKWKLSCQMQPPMLAVRLWSDQISYWLMLTVGKAHHREEAT